MYLLIRCRVDTWRGKWEFYLDFSFILIKTVKNEISPNDMNKSFIQDFGSSTTWSHVKWMLHHFFFQIFTFKLYLVIFLSWTLFVVIIFVIVFGPSAVARAALWNRVCPPLCLSRCLCGIGWLVFSEFWHGVRNPYEFVGDRIRLFEKTFHHIWGKLAKNGPKIGFSGFIE